MTMNDHPGEPLMELVRAWLHRDAAWRPATAGPGLLGLMQRHGVDGMAGALAAAGADIPDCLREPALEVYFTNSLRARRAALVCSDIRDDARRSGTRLSFVKGPALGAAYGDDGVRGFGDVDVLVPDGAAGRAMAARLGWPVDRGSVENPRYFWNRARGIGRVEAQSPHFMVEFTEGRSPAHEPLHQLILRWPDLYLLSPEEGDPFPVPPPHAHLLFLLQHLGLHWFNRLIWLADFAVLWRQGPVDTEWLESAAASLEMRKMLRAVTGACRRRFDETIPELGQGPVGWKDGLYLSMLAPSSLARTALLKYGGSPFKDAILGSFQPVMTTDLEHPSGSRRHLAPRWMGEWIQYLMSPGGTRLLGSGVLTGPFMFVVFVLLVTAVYRRTPRGFARAARREMAAEPAAGGCP